LVRKKRGAQCTTPRPRATTQNKTEMKQNNPLMCLVPVNIHISIPIPIPIPTISHHRQREELATGVAMKNVLQIK